MRVGHICHHCLPPSKVAVWGHRPGQPTQPLLQGPHSGANVAHPHTLLAICTLFWVKPPKVKEYTGRGRQRPTLGHLRPGQVCVGRHIPPAHLPTHLCRWHAVVHAHWARYTAPFFAFVGFTTFWANSTDGQGIGCACGSHVPLRAPAKVAVWEHQLGPSTQPFLQGAHRGKCGPPAHTWPSVLLGETAKARSAVRVTQEAAVSLHRVISGS